MSPPSRHHRSWPDASEVSASLAHEFASAPFRGSHKNALTSGVKRSPIPHPRGPGTPIRQHASGTVPCAIQLSKHTDLKIYEIHHMVDRLTFRPFNNPRTKQQFIHSTSQTSRHNRGGEPRSCHTHRTDTRIQPQGTCKNSGRHRSRRSRTLPARPRQHGRRYLCTLTRCLRPVAFRIR